MAIREYLDASGTRWQVWRVQPTGGADLLYTGTERRQNEIGAISDGGGRRKPLTRPSVTPGMERGWLCFESDREKRRLMPIPDDWEVCPEQVLGWYCRKAEPVRRARTSGARGRAEGQLLDLR